MAENINLLDINSAAQMLGVSKVTLRKWDAEGTLKPMRVGTRKDRRYRVQDLKAFMERASSEFKSVDFADIQKWASQELWFEEAPMYYFTIQSGLEEMPESVAWFSDNTTHMVFMFEKDYAHQILNTKESIGLCEAQMDALYHHSEKIQAYLDAWNARVQRLEQILTRLEFVSLEKCPQEKLLAEFKTMNQAIRNFWNVTLAIEGYGPYLDHVYLPAFEKKAPNAKKAKEAFNTLTTPTELSFIGESRKDLLEIIIRHLHAPRERKELLEKETPEALAQICMHKPELYRALAEYQQKYYWIQNSYSEWTILTITDFFEFIRDALRESAIKDLQAELERLKNPGDLAEQQKKWTNELNLSPTQIKELEFIRKITWLKDERKRYILKMLHPQYRFLHEFARRANMDYKLVAYALIEEIPGVLGKDFPLSILEERRKFSFFITGYHRKRSIVTGNEAEILRSQIFKEKKPAALEALHGIVASSGPEPVVTGRVKVILNPKDQTLSPDEILVTSMTRPDFMPLMKIAKGFITNEGGITCHAAIVSREMNKPCIIGTQLATKVLQTGDEVEMRMNHGIMNIKKRGAL